MYLLGSNDLIGSGSSSGSGFSSGTLYYIWSLCEFQNLATFCILFAGDYVSIMESLTFNGSATYDQQCLNITILNDDAMESSVFMSQREIFRVLLSISEPNDAVQLGVQTALVIIEDDDCKLSVYTTI